MPDVVLHLSEQDFGKSYSEPYLRLYGVISEMLEAEGAQLVQRVQTPDFAFGVHDYVDGRFNDGNLHIVDDMSVRMPNALNSGLAYFNGFWHLDPAGCRCFGSIGALEYSANSIAFRHAKPFFIRLRERLKENRSSRYKQTRRKTELPDGSIAVFFQGDYPRKAGATAFDDLAMLRDVLQGAGDRKVVVKPHPKVTALGEIAVLCAMAAEDPRIVVTDANIHDILEASCVSVSINSAVALEGFLHRTPAVLYGLADFHHFCETVSGPGQFAETLERAMQRTGGYAQYLTWYLRRNCLRIGAPDLEAKIWQIFTEAGFTPERFRR